MPRVSIQRLARDVLYAQDGIDLVPAVGKLEASVRYVWDLTVAGSLSQDWFNRHPLIRGWFTAFTRQHERLQSATATPTTELATDVEQWLQDRSDGTSTNPRYTHTPPETFTGRYFQVGRPPVGAIYVVLYSQEDSQVLGLFGDEDNLRTQLKVSRDNLLGRFTEIAAPRRSLR